MQFIWEAGKRRRVMHIARFTPDGRNTMRALCGVGHNFDRSINAPFALGRKVCNRCLKKLDPTD